MSERIIPVGLIAAALLALASICATPTASAASADAPSTDAQLPSNLEERLSLLNDQQRAFLESDEPLRILPSRIRLIHELERRTAEQVQRYVSDMMAAIDALAFQPEDDLETIPLNREAPNFNNWKTLRPDELRERRRDPGPFSLSRYIHPWGGIPTFAGAPVAITLEDLLVGNVEVAFAGIPQSLGSGQRDARNAPNLIRANYSIVSYGAASGDVYTLLDPSGVLNIADFGDFAVDRMSMTRSVDHIRDMARDLAATGVLPFFSGGDASVMYPTIRGVREAFPERPLTVVHFSAHPNAEVPRQHPLSDRDPVYNLLTDGIIEGPNLIQVGLRGPKASPQQLRWLRERGVRYHTMAQVERIGWEPVLERVLAEAKATGQPVYISMDASVFEPSEVAAVGRAVPNGLRIGQLMPLVRRLCAETELAGFELLDLAPMMDFSYVSALNSTAMYNACLSGLALRKVGIDETNYLAPLAIDHGQ